MPRLEGQPQQVDSETPLSERGPQTLHLMYLFRKTLGDLPEFQKALATRYFNAFGFASESGPVHFQRNGSGYSVGYQSSKEPEWSDEDGIDMQRERLTLETENYETGKGRRIILTTKKREGFVTFAHAEFRGYATRTEFHMGNSSEHTTNESITFERIEEVLEDFKPAE